MIPRSALDIRPLESDDVGYALAAWREGHKKSPGLDRVPWSYYKHEYGTLFEKVLNDPATRLLGAYAKGLANSAGMQPLVGWLVMTPGKRVSAVHWVHVKHKLEGTRLRRQGIMTALLDAADLGSRFIYTLRARRDRATLLDGTKTKSLDESLVAALRVRGVSATFVPLKEWQS
jgi:hypothetical protein